jgi:hypothetical protein
MNLNTSTYPQLAATTGISVNAPLQSTRSSRDALGTSMAAQFESVPDTPRSRRAIVDDNTGTRHRDNALPARQGDVDESSYVSSCAVPTAWQRLVESSPIVKFIQHVLTPDNTDSTAGTICKDGGGAEGDKSFSMDEYGRYLNALSVTHGL